MRLVEFLYWETEMLRRAAFLLLYTTLASCTPSREIPTHMLGVWTTYNNGEREPSARDVDHVILAIESNVIRIHHMPSGERLEQQISDLGERLGDLKSEEKKLVGIGRDLAKNRRIRSVWEKQGHLRAKNESQMTSLQNEIAEYENELSALLKEKRARQELVVKNNTPLSPEASYWLPPEGSADDRPDRHERVLGFPGPNVRLSLEDIASTKTTFSVQKTGEPTLVFSDYKIDDTQIQQCLKYGTSSRAKCESDAETLKLIVSAPGTARHPLTLELQRQPQLELWHAGKSGGELGPFESVLKVINPSAHSMYFDLKPENNTQVDANAVIERCTNFDCHRDGRGDASGYMERAYREVGQPAVDAHARTKTYVNWDVLSPKIEERCVELCTSGMLR